MEAIEGLGNEAFNVLTVLASGAGVWCDGWAWSVSLPPATPGGSTAVSDEAVGELQTLGLATVADNRMEITPLGRDSLFSTLNRWSEEALAIPLPA